MCVVIPISLNQLQSQSRGPQTLFWIDKIFIYLLQHLQFVWTPPPPLLFFFLLLHIKHFSSRTHQPGKWRVELSANFHSSRDDEETGASPRTSILFLSLYNTRKHALTRTHVLQITHAQRIRGKKKKKEKDFCSRMGGACHHRAPHLASQSKMSSGCC